MLWINIKLHTFFPDNDTVTGEHSVLAEPCFRPLNSLTAPAARSSFLWLLRQRHSAASTTASGWTDGRLQQFSSDKGFFLLLNAEFQCGDSGSGVS